MNTRGRFFVYLNYEEVASNFVKQINNTNDGGLIAKCNLKEKRYTVLLSYSLPEYSLTRHWVIFYVSYTFKTTAVLPISKIISVLL
jgi:hypothetical protein